MLRRLMVAGCGLAVAGSAAAQPQFNYTRVIGTGDALPGAAWQFGGTRAPEYAQGVMYFEGRSSDGGPESGIYQYANGQISKIFLNGDTIPATGKTILGFGLPVPHGPEFMIEIATPTDTSYSNGLYRYGDGQLTKVFDPVDMDLPGLPDIATGSVFRGSTASVNNAGYFNTYNYTYDPVEDESGRFTGMYRYESTGVSLFLDNTTPIPGTTDIYVDAVNGMQYDGTNLAFFAGNSPTSNGFFVTDGTDWTTLGSQNDIAAIIGTTSMGMIGQPQYADGVFAVNMNWSNSRGNPMNGIFLIEAAGTTKVLDTRSVSPEGGRFRSLGSLAQDEGEIVFSGNDTLGNSGIYRTFNGALTTVINTGDVIDGKTVQSVSFGKKAIFGDEIAFAARFDDDTFAYYIAPVIRGSDQVVPVVSVDEVINGIKFEDVATQAWIDSLRIEDFKLELLDDFAGPEALSAAAATTPDSASPLITGLTLPVGYGNAITISADGQALGTFGEGATVDIETLLGQGVESVSFEGFEIEDDTVGAEGVPVKLAFSTESASIVALTLEQVLGDLNGDGQLTNGDISAFVQALTDPAGYAAAFPGLDPDALGDFTGDGALTNGDIAAFVDALTGGTAIPEPTSLALLGLAGLLAARRRR